MASLADIRARLKAQEEKKQSNFSSEPNAIYPHWNINEGDTAIVRLLEDADPNNPYFWVERLMFKFPFNGIKGDPSNKTVYVQVPCMEMYGEQCPVLNEVRTWFKDPSLEEMGRKYWKKRSYLFQGFVRQNPLADDVTPENPIRRFIISPQIFTLIKNSLLDPEIEHLPTDKVHGLDFRISKTSKGGYADYSNSSWARKESELTDEELAAIDEHGLFNLKDFLPVKPNEEHLKVIVEMFEASVEGEAYDPDRWGSFYTPPGIQRTSNDTANHNSDAAPKASSKPTPRMEEDDDGDDTVDARNKATTSRKEPADDNAAEPKNDKAAELLAMIRSRQK
jgi:hypothetical protein